MKGYSQVIILIILLAFIGCSSDDQEAIDDTRVTYDKDIKLIIENHCFACHIDPPINGAPFPLVDYDQVSDKATDILTAISKQTGETAAMPPAARLPQSTIDTFAEWINNGMPEN